MKKALSLLAIVALSLGTVNAYAQEDMAASEELVETVTTVSYTHLTLPTNDLV